MGEQVTSGFGPRHGLRRQAQLERTYAVGLSVRDLVPSFLTTQGSVEDLMKQLGSGSLSTASGNSSSYFLPTVNAGVSWSPRLIPHFIEPSLCLEVQDPVSVISE